MLKHFDADDDGDTQTVLPTIETSIVEPILILTRQVECLNLSYEVFLWMQRRKIGKAISDPILASS